MQLAFCNRDVLQNLRWALAALAHGCAVRNDELKRGLLTFCDGQLLCDAIRLLHHSSSAVVAQVGLCTENVKFFALMM